MHRRRAFLSSSCLVTAVSLTVGACLERVDRWLPLAREAPVCEVGERRCARNLEECEQSGSLVRWAVLDNCEERNHVCADDLLECVPCRPGERGCDGHQVVECSAEGSGHEVVSECDTAAGSACRAGRCVDLCGLARARQSNVGCEYWAVDLDNAYLGDDLNAAAQQYAVVVSNPHPDLSVRVSVERDDTAVGEAGSPETVSQASIPPLSLEIFPLGPREVDGSPPGSYDSGTHTALSRGAYRVTSSAPVVAYQFNPLQNVDVFSNDASLLKPVEALGGGAEVAPAYVVLGWPQTIASSDDPDTNFSAERPSDLRAFLTIVGTRERTTVRVHPTVDVLGGGVIAPTTAGEMLQVNLDAFDVLNLETGGFNADLTGSLVEADRPVVVFSGGEASDAPAFEVKADRRCCADHLEEQLDPIRSAGKTFVAPVSFNRSLAVSIAGASTGVVQQREAFRIIAATTAGARVRTTLEEPYDAFLLAERGDFAEITTNRDFFVESDEAVMLGNVTPSQSAAGVPTGLPGGDPSFVIIPPVEQFRSSYVFLTPDRYAFDFLRIAAPIGAAMTLDGVPLAELPGCLDEKQDDLAGGLDADTGWMVLRCQLSFPIIDPRAAAGEGLSEGRQNDGVHVLLADAKVGVIVDGFDRNVSYGYAAGTELEEITTR